MKTAVAQQQQRRAATLQQRRFHGPVMSALAWQQQRCRLILARDAAAGAPVAVADAAAAPAAAPAAATDASSSSPGELLDIRVGRILTCERHPEADSLYVETIDLAEPEGPRTIVSGLVQFVPQEEMVGRAVLVLANLKAAKMRGIESRGMVLCASNDAHDAVEPLTPPEGAPLGERVWFGDGKEQPAPASSSQVKKKKIWEKAAEDLRTDAGAVATYRGAHLMTSAGPVKAASLAGARIS